MTSPRTALVVGATGVIGRPLSQALINGGWKVRGIARFRDEAQRDALTRCGIEPIVFDVMADDPERLPDAAALFLEAWDRRHIVGEHLEDCWALNFDAVGRVVRRYAGATAIVNGSTGSVYGPRADRPSNEMDPPRPRPGRPDTEYALSRLAQERLINFLCADTKSRVIHLRYFRANSPTSGTIQKMARSILHERSLGSRPEECIQVISLDDCVRCTVQAVDHLRSPRQAVNVVHPRVWTVRELADHIRQELGDGRVVFDSNAGGRDHSVWGDPRRMIQTFGEPHDDLDELIRRACTHAKRAARDG